MEQLGLHGLICMNCQGRHFRHAAVNDIKRSLSAVKISARLETSTLSWSHGMSTNGATLTPWINVRILVWDATSKYTFVPSYTIFLSCEPGDDSTKQSH